jgi:U32 family peptidase
MPVGVVTHYLDKINVVIVKLGADVRVGDHLVLSGEQGSFRQKLKSMQIDRQNVETAGRGKEVGIKVNKKAVVGEMVYVVG